MLIPLLSAGNFVIGMGAFMVVGLIPPLVEDLGVSTGAAGALMTVYAIAYAVGSPIGVALTGAVRRRDLLAGGMALFGAAAAASALSPDLTALYGARVLAAFGAGLFTPVAAAVAAQLAAPEARGTALANVFLGLTLAQVLGVPAGGFIAYTIGWPASFALVALLSIPVVVGILALVPADLPSQPTRLSTLAAALADSKGMVAVSFTAAFLGAIYVVYTFLAPILTETMGYGRDGVSAALLIFGLGAVAGNLMGGQLADRLGVDRTLWILVAAQIAILPVFSALPLPNAALMALVFIWSVFGWSFMAPQQARLIALAPERQTVMLALNAAAIYVGAALGSTVGALTVEGLGLGAVGLVGAALVPIAGVTLWRARPAAA